MEDLKQTVLVVDDDPDILRLVVTILRRLHYIVFPATGSDEALRIFNGLPAPPDLLLTDIVMPGANGPELAENILKRAPKVRVLFMSGFDNRVINAPKAIPLIPKPFTFENLSAKVIEVLRGPAPRLSHNAEAL